MIEMFNKYKKIRPIFASFSLFIYIILNILLIFFPKIDEIYFKFSVFFIIACCLQYFTIKAFLIKEISAALLSLIFYYFILPLLILFLRPLASTYLDLILSIVPKYLLSIPLLLLFLLLIKFYILSYDYAKIFTNSLSLEEPPLVIIEYFFLFICFCFIIHLFFPLDLIQNLSFPEVKLIVLILVAVLCSIFLWVGSSIFFNKKTHDSQENQLFHSDDPIDDISKDLLERDEFINNLENQIDGTKPDTSHVFGLYGSWGEGKTSILNILEKRFKKNNNFLVMRFDPWHFDDDKALLKNFYNDLELTIGQKFITHEFRKTIKKYINKLSAEIKYLAIFSNYDYEETIKSLKNELELIISQTGKSILILMDDLDRLEPDKMYKVIKLVRLNADLKNTIYLIALDQERVEEALSQKHGNDYLNKIIQTPVPLPYIDEYHIKRFLKKEIKKLFKIYSSEVDYNYRYFVKSFEENRLIKIFPTLRKAKCFLNSLIFSFPMLKNKVNILDYVLVEILRHASLNVYNDIYYNRVHYMPIDEGDLKLRKTEIVKEEDVKEEIVKEKTKRASRFYTTHNHISELLKNENIYIREEIRLLITRLFPWVYITFNKPRSYNNFFMKFPKAWKTEKNICHWEFFNNYFSLNLSPSTRITYAQIQDFFEEIDILEKMDIIDQIVYKINEFGNLKEFFNMCCVSIYDNRLIINENTLLNFFNATFQVLSTNIENQNLLNIGTCVLLDFYESIINNNNHFLEKLFQNPENILVKICFYDQLSCKQKSKKNISFKKIITYLDDMIIQNKIDSYALFNLNNNKLFNFFLYWFAKNKLSIMNLIGNNLDYLVKFLKSYYKPETQENKEYKLFKEIYDYDERLKLKDFVSTSISSNRKFFDNLCEDDQELLTSFVKNRWIFLNNINLLYLKSLDYCKKLVAKLKRHHN